MLMMHSVMMMVPLLLGVMLGVVLAAAVRRISMVNHVDAVAWWLASPDLGDAALGDTYLLTTAALMMILMTRRRQTVRAVARCLPRRRRRCRLGRRLLGVPRRIRQCYVTLVVDVHGESDPVVRHQLHGGADRRHRGGRVQLHQGRLQFQSIHPRRITAASSSFPISRRTKVSS